MQDFKKVTETDTAVIQLILVGNFENLYSDRGAERGLIKLYKLISSGAQSDRIVQCGRSLIYSQCRTMKTCSLHCFIFF